MWFALAKLKVFSGLTVALPWVYAPSPSYPLPPPTTLLGALAHAYLRNDPREDVGGASAASRLLNEVEYASAGARLHFTSRTQERVYQYLYLKKEYREMAFTVGIRGFTTYLDDELYMFYATRNAKLLKYVYGITRLGQKEGHVAVESVIMGELRNNLKWKLSTDTIFYVPERLVTGCIEGEKIAMPTLHPDNFTKKITPVTETFYIPRGLNPMTCNLSKNAAIIEVNGLSIILPREVSKS